MMIAAISETIRYILTLLFGVLVTAGILNIRITKKNIMILSVFCAVNLCLQNILIFHTEFIPGNCGLSADNPFTTSFAYDFCIS